MSEFDNKHYKIRTSGTEYDKQKAANYLSNLSNKITYLVLYMYNNNLPDQFTAHRLYNRWIHCELRETSSSDDSIASTVNKGHEIRLCIRNESGQLEDPNTSFFVILHELAHLMSVSYDHTVEFDNNFSYITHLASYLGIYKPENFAKKSKSYCGISIYTTPCSQGTCSVKR